VLAAVIGGFTNFFDREVYLCALSFEQGKSSKPKGKLEHQQLSAVLSLNAAGS